MKFSKWKLLPLLFVSMVSIDQWTKMLAAERLTTGLRISEGANIFTRFQNFYRIRHLESFATEPFYVFQPLWRMNYVENPGAAWGLFRSSSLDFRNWFFSFVVLAAAIFILNAYRKVRENERWLQVGLACVLSGAIGNFTDRLTHRYVVDFIEWYWWNRIDWRWPTFNVADSLIVVGVAILILYRQKSPQEAEKAPAEGSSSATV